MKDLKTCKILGTDINIITMEEMVNYIKVNLEDLRGKYICVSNVHTTVMAYENEKYREVQNSADIRLPDGKPLSVTAKKRGFLEAERVTGPDLMVELFLQYSSNNYRHFFYGSTPATLKCLKEKLSEKYPGIVIAGMFSPPFGSVSPEEDQKYLDMINETNPDIVWIGLGAPKQENYMFEHRGRVNGIMIGVGAGFDYCAENIKRAPEWMQGMSLEWLYRLMQDPKRLFKRYYETNVKFLKYVRAENKKIGKKSN